MNKPRTFLLIVHCKQKDKIQVYLLVSWYAEMFSVLIAVAGGGGWHEKARSYSRDQVATVSLIITSPKTGQCSPSLLLGHRLHSVLNAMLSIM